MEEKKVSIILPVYNAQDYLERCLNSVLNQDYKNIELIAIDDGSSDNSWNILEKYKEIHGDRIKIIKQKNMGVSKTRNKGISIATGEYLTFIDNDDFFDPGYIKRFEHEIDNNNLDVVVGGYKRPNSKGKIIVNTQLQDCEFSKYKIVAAWAKIYRTSYIKKNNIEFLVSNIGEDINFTVQAVTLTKKIKIIDYVGYNWYYNENSVSNTAHIYATRHTPYKLVVETLENNIKWLREKYPHFNENRYLGLGKMPGETLMYQFIVWFFIKMIDFKVIKLFMAIYCKI